MKTLFLASLLIVLLQLTTAQLTMSPSYTHSQSYSQSYSPSYSGTFSPSWTGTQSYSISGTESGTQSYTNSNSYTNSESHTHSQSYTNSNSFTNSNTYSTSVSGSVSLSGTVAAGFGYPQISGVQTTTNDFNSLGVAWQRPTNGFAYQSYEVILLTDTSNVTATIPAFTESATLTPANTNGLLQPGQRYSVQVRGYLNGIAGPLSFPLFVTSNGGDFYGTVGSDPTSVNGLFCNYYPQELNCKWNTGSRIWVNATFYVWCNRTVSPIEDAKAYIVQRVVNVNATAALPNTAVIPLPSGCRCMVLLTVFYATPVIRVDLDLTSASTGFVNTNKPQIRPNTPLVVPA